MKKMLRNALLFFLIFIGFLLVYQFYSFTPSSPVTLGPIEIELQPVTNGLTRPIFTTHAGDQSNRLFVVEQPGVIRILQNGELLPEPFLDIRDRVNDGGNEQGLLGLAFALDYAQSGTFFLNYTDASNGTVIARFQVSAADPNQADATSESLVLTIPQPARNHNGGMLLFGPDGYLYVGTGDGGAANDRYENGQNPDSLLGKMLRLDVTSDPNQPYTIPSDNPWINTDWNGRDVRDEIWAIGLRNPWRYSFDRETGDLWIGDVGQNAYEEVNFVPAQSLASGQIQALNFGWPIMEATHCFSGSVIPGSSLLADCDSSGLVLPVSEYENSNHCSITGGIVYRGARFPAMQGAYFYGDFCSGMIWTTVRDTNGEWQSTTALDSELSLSSFGEDEAGELYAVDLRGNLYQVVLATLSS